jgi:hypothetical protein
MATSHGSTTAACVKPLFCNKSNKINGRKRHIVVDTQGNLLEVIVHAANVQDYDGVKLVSPKLMEAVSSLQKIWADSICKYAGLVEWVRKTFSIALEAVKRSYGQKDRATKWTD